MEPRIPLTPEILNAVACLDHFGGVWSARRSLSAAALERLKHTAQIRSIAASSRLAGIRVADDEVEAVLGGQSNGVAERAAVEGYAAALDLGLPPAERLINASDLCRLNATLVGERHGGQWRVEQFQRESFDANGRATGLVFPTLPPRLVQQKTEELLTWLEFELRSGEQHRALVVGTFALYFNSISPFTRGNGRMSRLLLGQLLERAGYAFVPFASVEAEMETLRTSYHESQMTAQTHLWTGDANLELWLLFVLDVLAGQRSQLESQLQVESRDRELPPLQRAILEAVRNHGDVDAGLLLQETGANRNTLKDNLRRLVQNGVLEKTGQRRGTRYRLAGGRPMALPGSLEL